MLRRLALGIFVATCTFTARADETFPMFEAASRTPDEFTAALLAKPSFASTFAGATVDFNGPVAYFYVPMKAEDGVLYATLASAAAVVWASHAPHSDDDDQIAEVVVRFEWGPRASVEVDFPATELFSMKAIVWVHGTLDRALVISSSEGAEMIWPSCLRWYGRAPRFCAAVATDRRGYQPPI
jgi:hypothetical protein